MYLIWIFISQKRKREENRDLEGISVFSAGSASCSKRGGCCVQVWLYHSLLTAQGQSQSRICLWCIVLNQQHSTEIVIISWKERNNNIQRTKDSQHPAPSPWIAVGQYGMGQTVGFESQSFQKPVCGTELLEKVFSGKRRNQHVTF